MNKLEKRLNHAFFVLNLKIDVEDLRLNCHQNARLIFHALQRLGYKDIRVVDGVYVLQPKKITDEHKLLLQKTANNSRCEDIGKDHLFFDLTGKEKGLNIETMMHTWLEFKDWILETDVKQIRKQANEKKDARELMYKMYKNKTAKRRYIECRIPAIHLLAEDEDFKRASNTIFPYEWMIKEFDYFKNS